MRQRFSDGRTLFTGKDTALWGRDLVAVVATGRHRALAGTRFEVFPTLRRFGPRLWVVAWNVCGGVATGGCDFRTRREAIEAMLDPAHTDPLAS